MRILLSLCLLFPFLSFAQLFNPEMKWFEDENFFNQKFIKKNSIKQFRSSFSTKKDGEAIDETKNFTLAEFDRSGKLTKMTLGSEWLKNIDSTVYSFQYNNEGQLLNKGEFLAQLRFHYIHVYNDNSELEKIMKLDVSKLPSEVISVKKFRHEKSPDGKSKLFYLNDKGKAYIQETFERKGSELISYKLEYLVNSNFEAKTFNYIDGKLRTKTFQSNIGKNIHEEYNYYYNEEGNLDEVMISKDGQRDRKIAFVYNGKGLPSAMIVRYFQEKKMDIRQFDYEFYY